MKLIYILLGCLSLGLGALGVVLPLLPAFPFLLFAGFCFAKSSKRLHTWFVNTKLYKNNLESYFRELCKRKRNDEKDKNSHYAFCNDYYGDWIFYDGSSSGRKSHFKYRMAISYLLLCV